MLNINKNIIIYGNNLSSASVNRYAVKLIDAKNKNININSIIYNNSNAVINANLSNASDGPLYINIWNTKTQIGVLVSDLQLSIANTSPISIGIYGSIIHVYGTNFQETDKIKLIINLNNNKKIILDSNNFTIKYISNNEFYIILNDISYLNIEENSILNISINNKIQSVSSNIAIFTKNQLPVPIIEPSDSIINNDKIIINGKHFLSNSIIKLFYFDTNTKQFIPLNFALTDLFGQTIFTIANNGEQIILPIQSIVSGTIDIYAVIYSNGIASNNGDPIQIGKIINNRNLVSISSKNSIINSNFANSNFKNVTFKNLLINKVNFSNTDLTNSVFDDVRIENSNFDNAILIGADLSKATIVNSLLCGAIYDRTTLWPPNFDYKLFTSCSPKEYTDIISGKTGIWTAKSQAQKDQED